MRQQTYRGPVQWIIVDDCEPYTPINNDGALVRWSFSREVIRPDPKWNGWNTQHRNILAALDAAKHDKILFIEDDDYYGPNYLERMSGLLDEHEVAGQIPTVVYNVRYRGWMDHENKEHASFSQTGIRSSQIPILKQICADRNCCIDIELYKHTNHQLVEGRDVLSIKGMPGRPGPMQTHDNDQRFTMDPDMEKLREFIGDDAGHYAEFYRP